MIRSQNVIKIPTAELRQAKANNSLSFFLQQRKIRNIGNKAGGQLVSTSSRSFLRIVFSVLILAIIGGCSVVQYKSDRTRIGYTEHGIASFYSLKYQFRKTSSGERFSQLALTAAHRTLPFGTKVRVTSLKTNRSVVVKINDRGPFIDGRIIDLTRYAFSKIGDTEQGLIKVKIEVIS